MSEKGKITTMRIFITFFIVASAVIAILKDTFGFSFIAQMMGISWGALAGSFLAPFLYGLYWKKTTKASVAASFCFGSVLMIIQMLISMKVIDVSGSSVLSFVFRNSLYSGVFAMVGGLIIVPLVSLVTKKLDKSAVDEMFSCYDRQVESNVTESLGN